MEEKKYQNKFIFDYLKNILTLKSEKLFNEHISDKDSFNSFPCLVILRYLSMCQNESVRNIIIKNQIMIERLDKLGHKYSYSYLLKNIPKQNNSFIKYIK